MFVTSVFVCTAVEMVISSFIFKRHLQDPFFHSAVSSIEMLAVEILTLAIEFKYLDIIICKKCHKHLSNRINRSCSK